jgi:hypothetical protein
MVAAWQGNWKKRLLDRLQGRGFATLTDYLRQKPGVPYLEIADLLGKEDVAAFHVEWLHFEEAVRHDEFRELAIDSLVREISHHLPDGWKEEAKGDFNTASVWGDWIVRLENYSNNIKPIASAVWTELSNSHPPAGWKPQAAEDHRIVRAFDAAWPLTARVETHIVPRPNT